MYKYEHNQNSSQQKKTTGQIQWVKKQWWRQKDSQCFESSPASVRASLISFEKCKMAE